MAEKKTCIAQVAHLPYYYTPVIFQASWDPNLGFSLLDSYQSALGPIYFRKFTC